MLWGRRLATSYRPLAHVQTNVISKKHPRTAPPFLCYGAPLPATGLSDPIKPIPLRFYESCPLGDQHFKEINNFKATQSNVAGITALLGADSILTSCTSLHYLTAAIKKPAGTKWVTPCEYNATSGGLYSVQVGGISPSCCATPC